MPNRATVEIKIDERGVQALYAAVSYTLEKWAGEGYMDQEELLALKPFLQGCLLEFMFDRPEADREAP